MATIHISEAEAARDLHGLLSRATAGDEVVIETSSGQQVRMTARPRVGRPVSEVIAALEAREAARPGSTYMDEDFANDMREIIANRKPADRSAWD